MECKKGGNHYARHIRGNRLEICQDSSFLRLPCLCVLQRQRQEIEGFTGVYPLEMTKSLRGLMRGSHGQGTR